MYQLIRVTKEYGIWRVNELLEVIDIVECRHNRHKIDFAVTKNHNTIPRECFVWV